MNITYSVAVLVCEILAFWTVVITAFLLFGPEDVLTTHFWPKNLSKEKLRKKRQKRAEKELHTLQADLRNRVIQAVQTSKTGTGATPSAEELLELGIALNQTHTQEDSDNEKCGDHWLCNYRWFWFSIYQMVIATPILCLCALTPIPPIASATLGFVISVACGTWFGYLIVDEKTRAGITRFGEYAGFLAPGLQFRVPLFEQLKRTIILKNLDWGPTNENLDKEEASTDEIRISGCTGQHSNPSPGVFVVSLHGTYQVQIAMTVTLRVRRADRNSWYWWMFEFTDIREIGEMIAHTAQSILSTKAREVHDEVLPASTSQKDVMRLRLRHFLDMVPEITGVILQALYELTRERLGGVLPISVVITSIEPPEAFTKLLLSLDQADVNREVEEKAGQGRANRYTEICSQVAKLLGVTQLTSEQIMAVLSHDTALTVAQQQGTLDQYLKAAIVPLVGALAKPTK